MKHILLSLAIASAWSMVSCEGNAQILNPPVQADYPGGIIAVNEGPFSSGSGSLTYISADKSRIEQEVFFNVNDYPIGAVLNSGELMDGLLYVVSNVSGRVEIVNRASMKSEGFIDGLNAPRYVAKAGPGAIAISDWDTDQVHFYSTNNQQLLASVTCGKGPERMYSFFDRLYVLNSGGFERDSTVTVINLSNFTVEATLTVGDIPNSGVLDNGYLWVLTSGFADWNDPSQDTEGNIVGINLTTLALEYNIPVPLSVGHPGDLIRNSNGQLCFLSNAYGGSIMEWDGNNSFLQKKKGTYYALDYDHVRNQVVAGNALSFAEPGWMVILNSNWMIQDSIPVGLIPTDFVFN